MLPFTDDLLMSNSKTFRALSPLIIASILLMGCEAALTEEPAASDPVMTNEVEVEDKDPNDTEMCAYHARRGGPSCRFTQPTDEKLWCLLINWRLTQF